ncbi:MAG: hypothetical protein IJB70_06330 [Clostridia bacterium]|nr:hypothetical protein [Clostridia bacterium]
MNIPEINFGNLIYNEHEGKGVYVLNYGEVSSKEFEDYIQGFEALGYPLYEEHTLGANSFCTFKNGNDAIFAAYYPGTEEMRIVTEPNSNFFSFKDIGGRRKVKMLCTQIDLEDFGMSYVLRLCDGRFIIIDGGREWEPEADKLITVLKEQTIHEKPIIAAWIMTHPHCDHYRAFYPFHEKYINEVVIEKFLYNFPEASEEELVCEETNPVYDKEIKLLPKFDDLITSLDIPVYRLHTGQVYNFCDVKFEVLSSPDDAFFKPFANFGGFNVISVVFKMTFEGQVTMWNADTHLVHAKIAERWGEYLKSDIFQITHHGFQGGDIKAHRLANPTVCLLPVEEANAYQYIDYYFDTNLELFYKLDVQEVITGSHGNVTIELPYFPAPNAKQFLYETIERNRKSLGAKTWFFDPVTKDNCTFTFINAARTCDVYADLLFEAPNKTIKSIKINVPGGRCVKNILNPEDADGNALFFNRQSLEALGMPDVESFAVRFRSDEPIVITGAVKAVYSD